MIKQALQIIVKGIKEKAEIALELSKKDIEKTEYWKGQYDAYIEDAKMIEKSLK